MKFESDLDLDKISRLINALVEEGTTAQLNTNLTVRSQFAYDTDINRLKIYDGTAVRTVLQTNDIVSTAFGPGWNGVTDKTASLDVLYDTFNTVLSPVTASNGLTKVGNDIQLGGNLTGTVFIDGQNTNTLSIINLNQYYLQTGSTLQMKSTVSGNYESIFEANSSYNFSKYRNLTTNANSVLQLQDNLSYWNWDNGLGSQKAEIRLSSSGIGFITNNNGYYSYIKNTNVTGSTVTLEVPNNSGTIALLSDITGTYVPFTLTAPTNVIDINGKGLTFNDGIFIKWHVYDNIFYDNSNVESIDLVNRTLKNSSGSVVMNWSNSSTGLSIGNFGSSNFVRLKNTNLTTSRTYEFPNVSGTFALTSDLSGYLPITGTDLTVNVTSSFIATANNGSASSSLYLDGNIGAIYHSEGAVTSALEGNTSRAYMLWENASATALLTTSISGIGLTTLPGTTFYGFIRTDNLTGSDKTYQLPNTSGTFALAGDIGSGFLPLAGNAGNPMTGEIIGGTTGQNGLDFNYIGADVVRLYSGSGAGIVIEGGGGTAQLSGINVELMPTNGVGIGIGPDAVFHVSKNYSRSAWTTNGIGLRWSASTYTDTTSTGTVADMNIHLISASTVAASNPVTYTNVYGFTATTPLAGTNVTFTNPYAFRSNGLARFDSGITALGDINFFGGTRNIGTNDLNILQLRTNGTVRVILGTTGRVSFGTTAGIHLLGLTHTAASTTAWTTNGVGIGQGACTYTDTSSSGTVAAQYVNVLATATVAAANTTTYTLSANTFIGGVAAGTNVTNSATAALVLGNHLYFNFGGTAILGTFDSQNLNIRTNNTTRISISASGLVTYTNSATSVDTTFQTYTQAANTAGVASGLLWTAGAHTGQTASTEVVDLNYNLSATKTWATGAITTQRDIRIQARTYAFAGSSTVTTGSTLAISGAPTAGTNATITNAYALNVESGNSLFQGNILLSGATRIIGTIDNNQLHFIGNNIVRAIVYGTTTGFGIGPSIIATQPVFGLNVTATSKGAWTTTGVGIVQVAGTYTDTTSSGTVSRTYINVLDSPTIAASSVTTYTLAATMNINQVVAGTNVTIGTPAALRLGGNLYFEAGTTAVFGTFDSQELLIRTSNTSRIRILPSASGFVGIGSSSPTAQLDINGASAALSASSWTTNGILLRVQGFSLTDTSSSGTVATQVVNTFATPTVAASSSTTYTLLANVNIGSVTAGTNVTIGTPAALRLTGNLFFNSAATAYLGTFDSNNLIIRTANNDRMVLSGTNNAVGIGSATPTAMLDINAALSISAWTSAGVGLKIRSIAVTDTSSSGTVSDQYVHAIASPTINASSAVTYTNSVTLFVAGPTAGTNVTQTNPYAISTNGDIQFIGNRSIISTNAIFLQSAAASPINLRTGGANTRVSIDGNGLVSFTHTALSSGTTPFITFTQTGHTGGAQPGLLWTAGTLTGQTASTEIIDQHFNNAATLTRAAGAVTLQRGFIITGRTYAFASSSTITRASTLDVVQSIAGTNAIITDNLAQRWVYDSTTFLGVGLASDGKATFTASGSAPEIIMSSLLRTTGGLATSTSGANSNFFSNTTGTGIAATTQATLLFGGASEISFRNLSRGSVNGTLPVGDSYGSLVLGTQGFTAAASGVHALVGQVILKPISWTGGVATVTDSVTLYLEAAASGTVTGNNYALWSDAGLNRFDGPSIFGGATNVTNASVGLELNSTTLAFLLPRMTTTQKNALTAVSGMVVYDTTLNKMCVYGASGWETVTSV